MTKKTTLRARRCFTCDHFNPNGQQCRAHPPTNDPPLTMRAVWPLVRADHWCGEWRPRQERDYLPLA